MRTHARFPKDLLELIFVLLADNKQNRLYGDSKPCYVVKNRYNCYVIATFGM